MGYQTCTLLCLQILLSMISVQTQKAELETLVQVQVIIRHGERVPEYPYPTDPYNNETIWEEGWGQLTEVIKNTPIQNSSIADICKYLIVLIVFILFNVSNDKVGKGQEYALGKYLRTRYQEFLSEKYVPKEIYVLSSEADRTIMSAELCLAGLYPTENGTLWNAELQWQPVPLHTIEAKQDNVN